MCEQQSIKLIPLFSFMAWLTPWDYASSATRHTNFVKMPPKKNPSVSTPVTEMNLDDIRKVIKEELKAHVSDEMRDVIRTEMKAVIRDEVGSRLDALEREINVISDLSRTLEGVEKSLDFTSRRIDDLYSTALPAITSHIETIATGLAMQTLDLDMHRRKWGLTIQGLKGPAEEKECDTREACVTLAKDHLRIPTAAVTDFSACHRLSTKANAGIILRFRDLQQRNHWLENAKNLKNHQDRISISPDLPPVLRPLKTELLQKRKDLPPTQKQRASIRHLRQWPYVQMSLGNGQTIVPSITKQSITETIIGSKLLISLSEKTD